MKTVTATVQHGLCISCGVCKGICPKESIAYERSHGMYLPVIDSSTCIDCGLCAAVCPGFSHSYEPADTAIDTVTGTVLDCYNAWSRDPALRHVSASGGVVSTIIRALLAAGLYDGAFCLDSYDYREQLKTRLYTPEETAARWDRSSAPKSRYLPVSHENALAYIRRHREARLIFVAAPCALRGLQAAIKALKLDRSQYLLIGLFCDKVFNYNVLSYFQDAYSPDTPLETLQFKNKESGGWPGDMKLFPKDGQPFFRPLADRARAKAYFMPERCLYCVDKLNACADLSLGDNYTGKDASSLGSNSVIIRTQAGASAWAAAEDQLETRGIGIGDIQQAQAIDQRLENLYFGDLKAAQTAKALDLNPGVPRQKQGTDLARAYRDSLNRLRTGAVYDVSPAKLHQQMQRDNKKPNSGVQFLKRCYHYIKRRIP